jgi:hypothetical protein
VISQKISLDTGPALQDTQIARKFEKGALLDRLKEWEPMRPKIELAHFCSSWLPIAPNAKHWEPRLAGFPAIHATNLRNLRNLRIESASKKTFRFPSEKVCVRRRLILKLSECEGCELKGKNEVIYVNSFQ